MKTMTRMLLVGWGVSMALLHPTLTYRAMAEDESIVNYPPATLFAADNLIFMARSEGLESNDLQLGKKNIVKWPIANNTCIWMDFAAKEGKDREKYILVLLADKLKNTMPFITVGGIKLFVYNADSGTWISIDTHANNDQCFIKHPEWGFVYHRGNKLYLMEVDNNQTYSIKSIDYGHLGLMGHTTSNDDDAADKSLEDHIVIGAKESISLKVGEKELILEKTGIRMSSTDTYIYLDGKKPSILMKATGNISLESATGKVKIKDSGVPAR